MRDKKFTTEMVERSDENGTYWQLMENIDTHNNSVFGLIERWAEDRGIFEKATPISQFGKLQEEVQELDDAIHLGDEDLIVDAIGDCVVVLTILAKMYELDIEQCINSAYQEISKRKGKMENGVFVKEV